MKNKKIQSVRAWGVGLLFLVLMMIASCQEDAAPDDELRCQVEAIDGSEDDVVGKWKYVLRKNFRMIDGTMEITDLSCEEITLHFKSEGMVEVNNQSQIWFFESGDKLPFELLPADTGTGFSLKIGSSTRPASISKSKMIWNSMPLDGGISEFIRIE
ncbi:hypothetical protein Belba_1502 [Belliella baltica DSM 15883]|uniref:Lipocalin-like domain-containing protein n=1 Tax=Belliella baltica (strain DSM 15883 / CIP 108006 / LMG 21964 / BA134) TaxID=866536 RepID=I3Z4E8_BELBD|nr:hypothetical protein [Belliella baltica]AFL84111.1 hypothetical protein Belba_1497 [Belliella baltica DSM 15883]AFL84116.1 hypothetical protein Belba_1502 [Belliella baltica DSM 15883]